MKSGKQLSTPQLFLIMLTNPICIGLYLLFWSSLLQFFQFGILKKVLPMMICSILGLTGWYMLFLLRLSRKVILEETETAKLSVKVWHICAIVMLAGVTVFYGVQTIKHAVVYRVVMQWDSPSVK